MGEPKSTRLLFRNGEGKVVAQMIGPPDPMPTRELAGKTYVKVGVQEGEHIYVEEGQLLVQTLYKQTPQGKGEAVEREYERRVAHDEARGAQQVEDAVIIEETTDD